MIRRSAPALVCLAVLCFAARHSDAVSEFRVDEAATRAALKPERTEVSLAFENPTGRSFKARAFVELLDPRGRVRAREEREVEVGKGEGALAFALPAPFASKVERGQMPWFRLRYRVAPDEGSPPPAEGIVSLSTIAPDLFELHVSAPAYAHEGMRFRARVRAAHPVSQRPAAGVRLEAEAALDGEPATRLRASGTTDADGGALLDFELPRSTDADELRLKVRGRLGDLTQEAEDEVRFEHLGEVIVGTDKPIYQPGQTLHVRALLLDPLARRALPDTEARLEIKDPEGKKVFETTLRTTRFGVAAADWPIAEGTRLGAYNVYVEIGGDKYESQMGGASFTVSRYELPTFAVAAKPDRKYYVTGEDAEVEVRADYLFGKPVPGGRVRVVRESEREWDYQKQKWEVEEEESYEGVADAAGRFVARVKLADAHADLSAASESTRFRDHTFAAYVTDPSTNRTEQRRFDLRVTREPIHVYVIEGDYRRQAAGAPVEFYVSTFYADGTPASCEVEVRQVGKVGEVAALSLPPGALAGAGTLARVRTNRFGLAEVKGVLPARATGEEEGDADEDEVRLGVLARDAEGRAGRMTEEFDQRERVLVRVDTDKTIYRAGEPLRAEITSNLKDGLITLDAALGQSVVHSQSVRLRDGRASAVVPFRKEFRGGVTLLAYAPPVSDDYDNPRAAARTVLFPRDRELRFDVRLDRAEYRPGQEARADIRVRDADGREVESALGVAVTDRSVDARARTDADFGGRRGVGYADHVRAKLGEGESLAGVTRRDLDRLDLSKPPPEGLDLLAEVMLNRYSLTPLETFEAGFDDDQRAAFSSFFEEQFRLLQGALAVRYERGGEYPRDPSALREILSAAGLDVDALRDPWGRPYDVRFSTLGEMDALEFVSSAADKRRESEDDFVVRRLTWPYFKPTGLVIERVFRSFFERTGRPLKDRETLRLELAREGFDLEALRDRWGRPYDVRFEAQGPAVVLSLRSGGPDGALAERGRAAKDDFVVWRSAVNYFEMERRRIQKALDETFEANGAFPREEVEFRAAVARAGIEEAVLLDPWGRPYRLAFSATHWDGGHFSIRTYVPGDRPKSKPEPVSLRQGVYYVTLQSLGPDGQPDTYDEFTVTHFSRTIKERVKSARPQATPTLAPMSFSASAQTGELSGTVFDANGAVIPGANVTAAPGGGGAAHTTRTNDEGWFNFKGLAAGSYELTVEAAGFMRLVVAELNVAAAKVTEVEATLNVGGTVETVTVMAAAEQTVETTSSATSVTVEHLPGLRLAQPSALRPTEVSALGPAYRVITKSGVSETPRLREYFPETLVWQPLVETDREGRATLRFKLADNITTWKMAIIGSTADGELGLSETDIRSFQPFFVEHDPPRVLTEGDEISLPVVLRNYLEEPQEVSLDIKPEGWFTLLGPARKRARVGAGDAARETFDFRAVAAVRQGRQRVTAVAARESDAVEKMIEVHPDGAPVSQTSTEFFGPAGALDADFPAEAMRGTARAELKIYPNLSGHLVESVEAIMRRPYGCGEQTLSSTYPSVLLLRRLNSRGDAPAAPPVVRRAESYAREGYERLLGYRAASGGFAYWAGAEPDVALTAYALKFLRDAGEVLPVDEAVIESARAWLLGRMREDGSWPARGYDGRDSEARTTTLTAYVARVLVADSAPRAKAAGVNSKAATEGAKASAAALKRALAFLSKRVETTQEPYLLASFALAAEAQGEREAAAKAALRLASLRRDAGGQSFWESKLSTPFHGWGSAGRIETTALAVRALAALPANESNADLAARGLFYLLRQKDHFGVWHSTQATVNVLDAFDAVSLSFGAAPAGDAGGQAAGVSAEIFVNGRHATSVMLIGADALGAPVSIDLTPHVNAPGRNRVEIRRPDGAATASAQLVASFYAPWDSPAARQNVAGSPTLKVSFDRTEAEAGQTIACTVEAAPGSGGGMLLAEVGLPPGAEVDRASLERADADPDSGLDRYDVLPDRIVLYLWPSYRRAARLGFRFKPRYGLRALNAPSQIYDYYNPEARAVVAPTRFVVR